VQFVASQETLQQLVFWTMGSLSRANWQRLGVVLLALALVLPFAIASSWRLTALRLGEDRTLGERPRRTDTGKVVRHAPHFTTKPWAKGSRSSMKMVL
jgi:iron complex transport system permease protein